MFRHLGRPIIRCAEPDDDCADPSAQFDRSNGFRRATILVANHNKALSSIGAKRVEPWQGKERSWQDRGMRPHLDSLEEFLMTTLCWLTSGAVRMLMRSFARQTFYDAAESQLARIYQPNASFTVTASASQLGGL